MMNLRHDTDPSPRPAGSPTAGPLTGVLPIDKPAGITSAAAVSRVKRLLPRGVKIGHAGTLDPFATGLLLLLVGRATKRCEGLMDAPKQYEASIYLGATTPSDDPETQPTPHPRARPITADALTAVLPSFVGNLQQQPPVYSALKLGGRRACDRVRAGETVVLGPRAVQVYGLRLLAFDFPHARLLVDSGRGFYVRALARDLGAALDVGGYLVGLRRTKVGGFSIDQARSLDALTAESLPDMLTSPDP